MRKLGVIAGGGENSGSGFIEYLLPTFFDTGAVAQYRISNEACIIPGLYAFNGTKPVAHQVARVVFAKGKDGIWQRHPSIFRDARNRLIVLLVGGRYLRFESCKAGRTVWEQAKDLALTVGDRHRIGTILANTA